MKTRFKITMALLVLFLSAVLYIRYVPLRTGYLGVRVLPGGYQTNQSGQITTVLTISNAGPHVITAAVGTESELRPREVAYHLGPSQTLNPGEQFVFSIERPASPDSRLLAFCEKLYSRDWAGQRQALLDVYLLKRGVVERIYYNPESK